MTIRHFDERRKPFKGRKNVKNRRFRRFFDFLCTMPNPQSRQKVKSRIGSRATGRKRGTRFPPSAWACDQSITKTLFQPHLTAAITEGLRIEYPEGARRPSGLPGTYPQGCQILHKASNGHRPRKRLARRSPRPGGHRDPLTSGLYCQACAPLRSLSDTAHPVSPSDRNAPTVPKS